MICKNKKNTFKNGTFRHVSILFLLLTVGQVRTNAVESFPFEFISAVNEYSAVATAIESDGEVIWLGTLNGLIMIQPGQTEIYNVLSKHTRTNHVSNIAVNNLGEIWAVFVGGGIFYFNRHTKEHYLLQDKFAVEDTNCFDVEWNKHLNQLLLACDSELYLLDLTNENLEKVEVLDEDGAVIDGFYSLSSLRSKTWLIGTWGNGLFELDVESFESKKIQIAVDYINHINVVSPEQALLSTSDGVYSYTFHDRRAVKISTVNGSKVEAGEILSSVLTGGDFFLLVSSSNGLLDLNLNTTELTKTRFYSPFLEKKIIGYVDTVNSLQEGLSLGLAADERGFYVLPLKYNFTRYLESSSLSRSEVSMIEMIGGDLLMGDWQNLVKFDGQRSKILTEDIGSAQFILPFNEHYLLSTYENGFVEVDKSGSIIRKGIHFMGLPEDVGFSTVLRLSHDLYLLGTANGEQQGIYRGSFKKGFRRVYETSVVSQMTAITANEVIISSTYDGIIIYNDKSGKVERHVPNVEAVFIDCLEQIEQHKFFICLRRNKAMIFNSITHEFSEFLPEQPVMRNFRDAQVDKNGLLWLTSSYGLFVHDTSDNKTIKITKNEGVKSHDFSPDGMLFNNHHLIIPGNKGIVEIDVDKAKAFLDFKKSQKTKSFITRVDYILDEETKTQHATIEMMKEGVLLPHSNIVLKLKFSHNNFLELEDLAFDVRLVGLNSDWTTLDLGEYTTTYTTLPPGHYEFQVRVNDPRSTAAQPIETISIEVLPPWWQTTWAYLSYAALLFLSFHVFSWFSNRRLRAHNKRLTEEVNERTKTISALLKQKQTFFANVSHEFRTPLSLIMGPLDTIADAFKGSQHEKNLSIMRRNTNRLMKLVDQILDLAKFETSQSLPKQVYEIQSAMEIMAASFAPLLEAKKQTLRLQNFIQVKLRLVEDSFEMIITNLISNAIKYCPAGTEIVISMELSRKNVEISVSDNGPGISKENLKLLFERFTRFDVAENTQGSGIGLALVKQLVTNNGGDITVDSTVGVGTVFRVCFPLNVEIDATVTKMPALQVLDCDFSDETSTGVEEQLSGKKSTRLGYKDNDSTSQPRLLIVEDNIDLRSYLSDSLNKCYEIDMAVNGEQGLKKAQDAIPDLILSDVLMPVMDGYELANRIRSDAVTSHIPIILITAKGDDLSRMKGWEEQVDDYISKPFKMSELKIRIKRLLSIRDILRKKHTTALENNLATKNQQVISFQTKKDADFFVAFEKVIEEHFADEHFTRTEAAQYLNMVPRQLNRKLSALMDYNFSEYLRKYRLQKSIDLLLAGRQVTEVAYDVGFNSPSYFSSCFKAEFDETPSQFVENRESPQSSA